MLFEIQTHGTMGFWSDTRPATVSWQDEPATTIEDAIKVCEKIKANGYGVKLLGDGKVLLSAPWGEPVKLGHIVNPMKP